MKSFIKALKTTGMVLAAVGFMADSAAYATEGMIVHGNGARQKALGGAGVADSKDATAASLNPAGLVHVKDQLNVSLSVFSPSRSVKRSGATFGPNAPYTTSADSLFPLPNIAYSRRIDATTVLGLTAYSHGGGNTHFKNDAGIGFGTNGTLYADLVQMQMSVALAKQFGNFSVGIAPIFAIQRFEAKGLQNFQTWSTDDAKLSNNGYDWSYGGGLRAGLEWEAMPGIRFGAAGNTRIYMSEFSKYKGMFAEQGDLDMPATIQLGVAVDVQPNLTVMVDYKRIFYGDIKSLANKGPIWGENVGGVPTDARKLGADGGIGFGWSDIDIIKVGLEWNVDPSLTLRAGYSYNDNPLNANDLVFDILSPATTRHHITGGLKIAATDNVDFEISGAYMPDEHMRGGDGQLGPGNYVDVKMSQWELTLGMSWKLGGE